MSVTKQILRELAEPAGDLDPGYAVYPKAKTLVGAFGTPAGTVVELVGANAYNPALIICKWPSGQVMELEAHEYEPIS
jgi:hypothetical protein